MRIKIKKFLPGLLLFMVFLAIISGSPARGNEIKKSESELKAIQKQIKTLQNKIKGDEKLLKKERSSLQEVEKQIATINQKQAETQNQVEQALAKQKDLQSQADLERAKIEQELKRMGDLVLSQHAMGDQGYLKLLLGQQDPASIERTMVYYKYLAQFTNQRVTSGREEVKALVALEQKVNEQQQILNGLLAQQRDQENELKQAQSKRKQAIASLDNQLTKSANRVGRLQEDEKRIRKLVKGLQEAALAREKARKLAAAKAAKEREKKANQQSQSTVKTEPAAKQTTTVIQPIIQRVSNDGLGKLKGRLKMPVTGPILASYGSAKQGSGVKWNGIMLGVNQGEPVRSIYDGQVVYADWFKGFGQLVIVDHGQGYMSLYSHNSQITRSLGEQVKTNDTIAYTGSSGGLARPGLYFEVRYNGEPRDPLLWVKR